MAINSYLDVKTNFTHSSAPGLTVKYMQEMFLNLHPPNC
jgi:hypothetical protein